MTPRLVRIHLAVAASAFSSGMFAQNPPPLPTNPAANQPAAAQSTPNQPVAGQVAAPRPGVSSIPAAGNPDEEVSLVLPDADIDTVLSALEIYTGRIILRPQALATATYNLKIKKAIPKSEAILAIETVLALNKIGLAPLGDRFLKVVNIAEVKQEAPEMITGSSFDRPASGRVATKLFQLEFMRVAEFVPMLSAGITNPFYGQPVQLPNANAVLITDAISNLQRIEALLQQVDKPVTAGMKPKFYPVRNTKASDLVTKLRAILTGTLQVQLGQATTYSADDRTNQIVLVTDPRQHAFFDELIEKLDQRSDPNTRTEVLYLKHAKAEDVVTVLTRIITQQTGAVQKQGAGAVRPGMLPPTPGLPTAPGATPAPGIVSGTAANNPNIDSINEFSAFMTVVNDNRSNAVVVFGTSDDIRLVTSLVDKLDITLSQVRIEVVIADVTVGDNDQTGINALGLKLDGDKLVGFSGGISGDGFKVSNGTITRPGTSGHMDLAAEIAIGTTPRKNNTTILSHPSIVTSHGKKAYIFLGETRPVVTGTLAAAGGAATAGGLSTSSTVNQQPIGTRLTVEPFIGIDGSINLNVTQKVEDVTGEVLVDQNRQYIIGQRETESNVSAKSGDILVFAGFRKQNDQKSTSRLGPIPIIGDIFGTRTKSTSHQEVIFFLRPTVLTNKDVIDTINAETMQRVEKLPSKEAIKENLDPNYIAPKKPLLDRILPK